MNAALMLMLLFDGDDGLVTRPGLEYTALGRVQYTADEGSIHYTAEAEDA